MVRGTTCVEGLAPGRTQEIARGPRLKPWSKPPSGRRKACAHFG
jgi:hypothetical protein